MRPVLLILAFLMLSIPRISAVGMPSDSVASPSDSLSEPVLVWQRPFPAVVVTSSFMLGASPLFFEFPQHINLFFREEVQMFRRNYFDFRHVGIDDFTNFIPLVSVVGLNLLGVPSRHDFWKISSRAATTAVIVTAIVQPVKRLVHEVRPDMSSSTSFPSGHTAFAFAGAELLRLEYSETSPFIPAVGFAMAALTGFLRVYNNRHWTSDVLAGAAVGFLSADLSYILNGWLERRFLSHR